MKKKVGYQINNEKSIEKLENKFKDDLDFFPMSSRQVELYDMVFLENKENLSEEMRLFLEYFDIPVFEVCKDLTIDADKYENVDFFTEGNQTYMVSPLDNFYFKVKNTPLHLKNESDIDRIRELQKLNNTVESKEDCEVGHSLRVAKYAKKIADALLLPKSEVENIYFAGLFHDIGKIGIPENILVKPGKLNDREYEVIKKHSILGTFLFTNKRFHKISQMIEEHHERYDGSGYPKGKKKNRISIGGRILSLADSYDAMTSPRPYSTIKTTKEAIEEINLCSKEKSKGGKGLLFDPKISSTFIELLEKEKNIN